jgi:hypothetical protein
MKFKIGDRVYKKAGAGFIGWPAICVIADNPENKEPEPCFICDDEGCVEWPTCFMYDESGNYDGTACHVSECQMETMEPVE